MNRASFAFFHSVNFLVFTVKTIYELDKTESFQCRHVVYNLNFILYYCKYYTTLEENYGGYAR